VVVRPFTLFSSVICSSCVFFFPALDFPPFPFRCSTCAWAHFFPLQLRPRLSAADILPFSFSFQSASLLLDTAARRPLDDPTFRGPSISPLFSFSFPAHRTAEGPFLTPLSVTFSRLVSSASVPSSYTFLVVMIVRQHFSRLRLFLRTTISPESFT